MEDVSVYVQTSRTIKVIKFRLVVTVTAITPSIAYILFCLLRISAAVVAVAIAAAAAEAERTLCQPRQTSTCCRYRLSDDGVGAFISCRFIITWNGDLLMRRMKASIIRLTWNS